MALSSEPARQLTDRECVKLIGATIGGLLTMANEATVRRAVQWWMEHDAAWHVLTGFRDSAIIAEDLQRAAENK